MAALAAVLSLVVLVIHFAFVLFVALGCLIVLAFPRRYLIALHLACVAWGAASMIFVLPCPLTWTENRLRAVAGWPPYPNGCLDWYVPRTLSALGLPSIALYRLALAALLLNIVSYGAAFHRARARPPAIASDDAADARRT